jgi:hypothetical protein
VIKSSRDYPKNRKGDLLDESRNSFAKGKKGKEEKA